MDCRKAARVFAPDPGGESRVRPVQPDESPFDKSAVARSFGRAAQNYDSAAHLQRAVCRQLLSEADSVRAPKTILDLGSGTGYGSELLRRRFPQARIIALDLAEGMLQFARSERPVADFHIAADAEQLPLADGSVDLVFSSMALQWCYRLPQLFAELNRVLADGGRCLVATLGPGTLSELKDSWSRVDDGVHVNRFLSRSEWISAAAASGLPGELRIEERVLHFDSVRELMRELKSVGAHNVNRDAGRGLMVRGKLRRLAEAYEPLRSAAGLPASYEVIYLKLAQVARTKLVRGA
ncbi:malonyl-ACP O-methyltransferase BioC [Microbulbifer taiwanensis]|uniref:malonyl-ACP O-methyltransferase BioC n=1 Tax=Microbulbifer taiwanensis TaxID=986746 RepID=UPI00360C9F31